jgi:hypothetical protein
MSFFENSPPPRKSLLASPSEEEAVPINSVGTKFMMPKGTVLDPYFSYESRRGPFVAGKTRLVKLSLETEGVRKRKADFYKIQTITDDDRYTLQPTDKYGTPTSEELIEIPISQIRRPLRTFPNEQWFVVVLEADHEGGRRKRTHKKRKSKRKTHRKRR